MDHQAGEETSTRRVSGSPPPPAGRSSGSDEPADNSVLVRGDLGASRPRGRWASRSRNRLMNKGPYDGGARDEADGGVRSQAGHQLEYSGSSMVQAHGGGGPVVHDQAAAQHCPSPTTKMGTQQDHEEEIRSAGLIGRTVLRQPSYRSRSAGHHRSRSRQNPDDDQAGVRSQADDQDGSDLMDPLHTKNMDRQADQEGETTAGLMISTPPADHNSVGGVRGASRPQESSAGSRSRNRPRKGPYCDEGSSTVDRFLPAENEEYGSVDNLRTKLDGPITDDQEETATGIMISCTPPVPSFRSGGQHAADNFSGEVLIGASRRPRGRRPDDHYRGRYTSRPWPNEEEGSYGGSVRDLVPDDQGAVRFQAGVHHDHHDRQEYYRRPVVRAAEYGRTARDLQQAADHRRQGARHCDRAAEHEQGGARSNIAMAQADGGVCLFQDGHDEDYYSTARDQADGGLRVYDNVVVGDPSGVIFGRGNYAGGRVSGRVSGNRVIR